MVLESGVVLELDRGNVSETEAGSMTEANSITSGSDEETEPSDAEVDETACGSTEVEAEDWVEIVVGSVLVAPVPTLPSC